MKRKIFLLITTPKNTLIALLILLVGLVLTIIATVYTKRDIEKRTKKELYSVCSDIQNKIYVRLQAHSQLLYSGSALFAASKSISRKEWKAFYDKTHVEEHLYGMQGLGFALIVKKNDLQQHIQNIRKEGFPDYNIRPTGDRNLYTSIIYLEPFTGRNLRAFGYDMMTDPVRRRAMEMSCDYNLAVLSDKIILVQETNIDIQAGAIMYVPVYRNNWPINTVAQRRIAIIGWIYSPCRMNDFMEGIIGSWDSIQHNRTRLQIYNNESISEESLLFDSQRNDTLDCQGMPLYSMSLPIEFNDRKWTLLFTQYNIKDRFQQSKILIILISGTIISFLLFILSLSLLNTRFTARGIAEQLTVELKEGNERFQTLLNSSAEAIYGIDMDGCCTFSNNSCIQMLGYSTSEELLGKNMHNQIHHSHADGSYFDVKECNIYKAFKLGTGSHVDDEVLWRADGTCFPAEYWSYPIIVNGKVEGAVVTFFDITERKKAEISLANMAKRTEILLNTARDGIHVLDEKGNIVEANPAFCRMLGYTQEEMLQLNVADWDNRLNKNELSVKIDGLIKTPAIFESQFRRKDGSLFDVEVNGTGITLDGQNHFYASVRDITARKLIDETMQQNKINYESFFNTINDFVFVLNVDGNIIRANNTIIKRLGFTTEEELIGQSILMVHPAERRAEAGHIIGKMLVGKAEFCSVPILTKSGIQIPVETRVSFGYWDGKPVIFGIIKDISQIKLSEEKFSKLFYINPSACGLSDADTGKFIEVNNEFYTLFGFEKNEVIGKTITQLGMLLPDAKEFILQNTDSKGNIYNAEVDLRTKHGEIRHVLLSAESIHVQEDKYQFTVIHDITARKQAEEALYESNKKLEAIILASPDGIGMLSLDGKIQLVSDKLAEMYGYSKVNKNEFIGFSIFDFVDPSFHNLLSKNIQKLLSKTGSIGITEYIAIKKDKSPFFIDVNSTVLLDSNGNPEYLLFIERDITERKQVDEILKSKTSLLEAQTNATIDAILIIGENHKRILINQRIIEMFNVPQYIVDDQDDTLLLRHVQSLNKYPEEFLEKVTFLYNHPDVTSRDEIELTNGMILDRYSAPVYGKDGKYYGRIWSFRDITENKMAEVALTQASMRLSLATRAGGVGVWDFDFNNNKFIWDDQMYSLYGITKDSFSATYEAWLNTLHSDDIIRGNEEIQKAICNEKEFDTEFRVCWPNGSVHNIRALAIVMRDESGKPLNMIGTNWDITEQKKSEEALIKAKQDADIANKSKSEFLANMSHEIRTPMNAILGFSEALYHKLESEQQKKMIKSVLSSGNLLMSLLNDILDLSKIEAGKLDISLQPVNLNFVIQEVLMLFKDKAQSKGLELNSNSQPDFPTGVMLDEIHIKQILFNLVGNALKFTHTGYVSVNLLYIPANEHKGLLQIEVEDTGIGIRESQRNLIFEAFVQQEGQSNREYGGTGLGLAISKRLIEKMNGSISVKSVVGKGSTFTIVFPEVDISEISISKTEYIEENQDVTFENATILIIDDVESNIETIENLLSSSGLVTISAENGETAIEILNHTSPALILLDMRMSGIDGYEVAKRIKENPEKKHIPIIAFTASVMSSKKIESSGDFDGHLYKPVKRAELFKMFTRFLKYSPKNPILNTKKTADVAIVLLPEVAEKLPEIIKTLKEQFIHQWESIKDSFVLFNIDAFADDLKKMAIKYHFQYLEDYANKIEEEIESIDLESLKETLKEFPEIVKKVEELRN